MPLRMQQAQPDGTSGDYWVIDQIHITTISVVVGISLYLDVAHYQSGAEPMKTEKLSIGAATIDPVKMTNLKTFIESFVVQNNPTYATAVLV